MTLGDFRNWQTASLQTAARFVVISGDNAQGKTNILESVYVLATLRSFREAKMRRLVRDGAQTATAHGVVQGSFGTRKLRWALKDGRRHLAIDKQPVQALEDWFALIRAIVVAPEHTNLIRGDPAVRRQFLDRAVFTVRPAYLELARNYRRVIRQKASLLREGRATDAELDVWDTQLVDLAGQVVVARRDFVHALAGPLSRIHEQIASSDSVSVRLSGWGAMESHALKVSLQDKLREVRPHERRRRMVLVGPHRDDLQVEVGGRSARRFASQGQARTLALTLKLAEMEVAEEAGVSPILLLDDVSSELDKHRVARVMEVLKGLSSQVWITTTDPDHLGDLATQDRVSYRVGAGEIHAT